MNENFNIKEFFQVFQNLYWFALDNKTNSPISEDLSRITHGNLCRYSKDLLDALVCLRNRFEQGKPYILNDIMRLNQILESPQLNNSFSQEQIEELTQLVSTLTESYESICNFAKAQDFNHL